VDPPAGQGTIRVIGLVGKVEAADRKGKTKIPGNTTTAVRNKNPFFILVFIGPLLRFDPSLRVKDPGTTPRKNE
jgi:hypothetical protein